MKENEGLFQEVVLVDEDGKDVRFDHVMTFDYEKLRYIALLPIDKVEGVDEDEVILLNVVKVDGEDTYVPIKNPVLLEEVFDRFIELFEETVENDDDDDDDETDK